MVMPPMKEAPVPSEATDLELDLGVLRELRAEAQDLQDVLESIRQGNASVATYAGYIDKTRNDIAALMAQIRGDDYADSMRHLRNIWEQMLACPLLANPSAKLDAQDLTRHITALEGQIRKLVFEIGYLAIPPRINEWLKGARPGYYIPFHEVFEDELPSFEDRQALLGFLAHQPACIEGGLVDAENGLIYRYAPEQKDRRLSYLFLGVAVAVAVGIVVGAAYLPASGWPLGPGDLSTLLVGWGAVWVGVLVHIVVSTTKRVQSQKGHPPVMAIGDIPLMLNAKIGQVLFKILVSLVAILGLALGAGIDNTNPLNALLVGYSLDSVIEIFGASVEQRAAAQVSSLKQKLGVTPGP